MRGGSEIPVRDWKKLVAAGAFALQFAIELAFGLAQFAGEALEGFLLVDWRFRPVSA